MNRTVTGIYEPFRSVIPPNKKKGGKNERIVVCKRKNINQLNGGKNK